MVSRGGLKLPAALEEGMRSAIATQPRLLSGSQARSLAEALWGPRGTTAYRTNRSGAFHFSCSGHGGFVIDDRALTNQERAHLQAAGFKPDACWGVLDADGQIVTIRHPDSQALRPRPVSYRAGRGEVPSHDIPAWVFEEDCDWAAVPVFTGIHSPKAFIVSEAALVESAKGCLSRWNEDAYAYAGRAGLL